MIAFQVIETDVKAGRVIFSVFVGICHTLTLIQVQIIQWANWAAAQGPLDKRGT